jgi:glycosyltransferase involved in cell wall biosynthesis
MLLSPDAGYRQSGIHRYIAQLVETLPGQLDQDQLAVFAPGVSFPKALPSNLTWRQAPSWTGQPLARIAWEQLMLPEEANHTGIDLFHGTANALPLRVAGPAVVTIHDLAFLRWPETVSRKRKQYLTWAVGQAARRATRIIAVSNSGRDEIIERLDVPADRIHVTPLGVDSSFHPLYPAEQAAFRELVGLERPYLLAVGTLEPRKNLPALIRAFRKLLPAIPHDLVLIGAEGWLTEEIHRTIADPRLAGRIKLTGFVPPEGLPNWYGAADLFVIPSLHEGFGLTLLEALACAVPAVSSNAGSLPEVAGDAALLVEPSDEALADGIKRLLGDDGLRNQLRERGPRRAAQFTWTRTAQLTVEAYRQALHEAR